MRGQSMRKSARSSTAALVWTTVQQETRSSGPAALAVDRYGRNPRATFQRLRTLPSWNATSHGSGDEGDGHLVAASVLKPAVVHGRVRRVVALAVSPPAPPSKRPCPTARRRGCSWSGAVTASPWLLRVKQRQSWRPIQAAGARERWLLTAGCRLLPCRRRRRVGPASGLVTGRAGQKSQTATDRVAARLLVRGSGSLAYRRTSLIWLLLLARGARLLRFRPRDPKSLNVGARRSPAPAS